MNIEETQKLPYQIVLMEIEKIKPNPYNPRRGHSLKYIQGLAETFKRVGLQNPPTAIMDNEGNCILVDGHGRFEGFKKLGLERMPIQLIKDNSRQKSLFSNFYQRKWKPFEEAVGIHELIHLCGIKKRDLAKCLGYQPAQISQRIRIAEMVQRPRLKEKLYAGKKEWQFTELRELSEIKDETAQLKRIEQMLNGTSPPHSDATENNEKKNEGSSKTNKKPADNNVSAKHTLKLVTKALDKLVERLDALNGKLPFPDAENLRKGIECLPKLIEAAERNSHSTDN